MGCYIQNMEMPEKCGCCFAAFPDGVGHSCCLIKSYPTIDNQKGRRSDCPLVPVPPHGDLIDRTEAIVDANERAYDFWSSDAETDAAVKFLQEQVSIIPAEEG